MTRDELKNNIINNLHSIVAQCAGDDAYFVLGEIIDEARELQDECDIIRHFRNDDNDDTP